MAINLVNVLRKSFTEQAYQEISQYVDINTESTKNGVKAIIPVILASILGNNTENSATQPSWWNTLKDEYPFTDDEFIDTDSIKNSSFIIKGREILAVTFKTYHDELVASVSSIAGIQKEKAATLIEVSVPLIVGFLTNWLQRKGWKFKDLIKNLLQTKPEIIGALPIGISPAYFSLTNVSKNDFSKTIETAIPTKVKITGKSRNGLMWFIGLVVLALVLWYFLS